MLTPPDTLVAAGDWQQALAAHDDDARAAVHQLLVSGQLNEADWVASRAAALCCEYRGEPDLRQLDAGLAQSLNYSTVRRLGVLPAQRMAHGIEVWARWDLEAGTLLELGGLLDQPLHLVLLTGDGFETAVRRAFERTSGAADAIEDLDEIVDLKSATADLSQVADLLDAEDDAPIIRMLNAVLAEAIEENASDIHIETYESRIVVRYRVDGMLRDVVEPPKALASRITARVKVMARLNIAEKRVPQDGRISLRLAGRTVDVRVSTVPTHYGERIVMRILEKERGPLTLDHIGMDTELAARFSELLATPHGIFLVTGPTGSGKTTTLYAALQQVQQPDVNIITVEDPVEYELKGASQIPVNPKAGMSFSKGLRAILRQDPDVIMVGEIRDLETAEIAVQASLTGHRVFSTLHTNDAVGSVTRLVDMGVEPYLVASSLIGTMAQRLVRRLCADCCEPRRPSPTERRLLGIAPRKRAEIFEPRGCETCGYSGYRGRVGLFELLTVDESIRQVIHDGRGESELREMIRAQGMPTLREDGLNKVLAGATSIDEILRVAQL